MRTLAAAAVLLSCASARADTLVATLGLGMREVSHSVDVKVADGVATMTVRRVFHNPGGRADEAQLDIELPPGAAATGLRIRARDRWYAAELMEREKAARLYQELTGMGVAQPKDPALLYWVWPDKLHLQIFPVFPGAASTVEYTLTVPTRYRHGEHVVAYPRPTEGLAPPIVRVIPAHGDATTVVVVDDRRVTPGAPVVIARPDPIASGYEGAGLAIATLDAEGQGTATAVTLELEIDHTYRGDLQVELMTPLGAKLPVTRGAGSENDVRGRFPVALPKGTPIAGRWRVFVSDHAALDTGTIEKAVLAFAGGKKVAAGDTPRFIPDARSDEDAGLAEIRVGPPEIRELTARLGRVAAGPKKEFSRLEVDVAPRLSALPKHAQVVFVIDASHSIDEEGVDRQLAIAAAYLSHVEDAEAEVVLVRRAASRLFGRFVGAAGFGAELGRARAAGRLAPGNGSHLELGIAAAGAALKDRRGERRMVVFTDTLLRDAFSNELALAALARAPDGTIVHLVEPLAAGEASLARDDAAALAPIPTARGGIYARFEGDAKDGKGLARAALELVRPIRLDDFTVKGLALADPPASLAEGEELRAMLHLAAAPVEVALEGKLWARKVRHVARVEAGFSRAVAGWVFSEDEYGDLTHDEQLRVAFLAGAVSPVTSYLAVEPGTRPSRIGLALEGRGVGGSGSGYGVGSGRGGMVGRKSDLRALLADGVRRCVEKHHPAAGWSVTLDVETTLDEVVDVKATAPGAFASCLVEAAWAVRLDATFHEPHKHHTLALAQ